ncbi:MAG: ATP-binding protein [Anaerolineae bacterium]|nr:ATP-binding protein [Anaerolineae bacterium]NUQ04486.1 response regulator [Anaerolineae bacterium]
MQLTNLSFRDTLRTLRIDMVRSLTTVAGIFCALAAYSMLLMDDFHIDLFILIGSAAVVMILLRRQLPRRLNVSRYGLLLTAHLTLFVVMRLTGAPWLPFFGVLLVLISGMTTTYMHWISALTIFGATALLQEPPIPLLPLGATLALTVAVMQTSVTMLYTALTWYSAMQRRADALLEETRRRQAELAQTVKSLEIAYTNMRRMQQQLIGARQQADEARRMKERFAANISHELRTPLNLILGFSEIMVVTPEVYGEARFAPKLTRDLYQIYSSSRHLLALIDDVLDLSQVELATMALNQEPVQPNAFIEESVEMFRNIFRDGKLQFNLEVEPDLPIIEIDRTRIRQVILNLLGNAHRFTTVGSVTLKVRCWQQSVQFSVSDTGRGIPPDKLGLIFDEFYQVDYSLSRNHGGAGLGLAISKRFVERHGGVIEVSSEEGVGSTFTFTLPIHTYGVRGDGVPSDGGETDHDETVLVLDRDPTLASLIRRHLPSYQVVPVGNSAALAEALEQYAPRAVIDNRRLAQADLPAHEALHIRCALPSASWMMNQLQVQSYLPKPFSTQQLVEHIRRIGPVRRVLVVDDDVGFVQLIQRGLETLPEAYTVSRAYDGEQALNVIGAQRPDLLLLDLAMPTMDGFMVLQKLRADPNTADLPIILLTATQYTREESDTYGDIAIARQGGLRPAEVLRYVRAVIDQA